MALLISPESVQGLLVDNPAAMHPRRLVDVAYALGTFYTVLKNATFSRRNSKTTALNGPPDSSFVWGIGKMLLASPDSGPEYEKWAEEYGGVYEVSELLEGRRIILCDPKAIAHFYGEDRWMRMCSHFGKLATENVVSKGILSAKRESHDSQRKMLTPAFSNVAMRNLTSVFYDSAYKAKGIWESLIESNGSGSAVIEVQKWMNHISLDTIGIAGFSHDFGSLDGKRTPVMEVFDAFDNARSGTFATPLVGLTRAFSRLEKLPTPHLKLVKRMDDAVGEILNMLFTRSSSLGEREESSILDLLIRAETHGSQPRLTREEVMAQAKVLLFAGYETMSIGLTWAFIELSRNPDMQTKLRTELLEFGADPTYDQLLNNLPYLDAVVHETLRIHAPLPDLTHTATEDDVIPLSKPVRTRSGELVDHISVAKGTHLLVSVSSANRSTALWGPDAKVFKPERWIGEDDIPIGAKEVRERRDLLTFLGGPKTCLGKEFAIAGFKVVLSVLVKRFVFELRDGPGTVIEMAGGLLLRPRAAGEQGTAVPLRVRRFE